MDLLASAQLIRVSPPGESRLESVPEEETAAIAAITEMISTRLRVAAKPGLAARDAHPKGPWLRQPRRYKSWATSPTALSQGLFADAASYQCWVRFYGSGTPQRTRSAMGAVWLSR